MASLRIRRHRQTPPARYAQPRNEQRPRLRRRLPAPRMNFICALLVLFMSCIVIRPVNAASVSFSNCLSDEYRNNKDPVLLQWVPLHVDASFDTSSDTYELSVILYGNVTGSRSSTALAAWNSTEWADDDYTDGKILREPDPTSASPKLTTLHSKVDVLSYEPWSGDTDFCQQSLTNATCPLGPVFNTSHVPYYDLPSISLSRQMNASYSFASFTATFLIRYGDNAATTIGCVSASVTPSLGGLGWAIKFLPLMVLAAVGFATVFAGMYSPWGTTDVFHWSSNYGRDPDLLRLVTPGFGDCLQYLQFVVLTGGLTLSYPGFYQPIVSQAAWSSLMFNQTIVSKYDGMHNTVDGIYYTNGTYGLQNLAQLAGMGQVEDVWAGMMVWLLVIIGGSLLLFQLGFAARWIYRSVRSIPEEDLRSKNWPFSIGHVIRIVFNFLLLPIVALSCFQLVEAGDSPAYLTALAVVTLIILLGFAGWLLYLIITTKPRAVLFDDLPTLLLYGPLYNTYSDEAAFYALSPFALTFMRGIAIGAVQPAGIAQIVLLAICEVVQVLTLQAIQPFHRQSSMNAYHTLFATLRFATIMLMISFIPVLDLSEAIKGWIGYVILVIHAGVLVFGFFLNAVQTILEVIARMAGAGGDNASGQTRGGLSKIFGMRQLARRTAPRRGAASRQSQMSSAAMLVSEDTSKAGYVMPSGRLRSESAGSIGAFVAGRPGQRSSSVLDNLEGGLASVGGRNLESSGGYNSAFTPTTMGEMSTYSYLPSPHTAAAGRPTNPASGGFFPIGGNPAPVETADPYYRPPRRPRRSTINQDNVSSPAERTRGSWADGDWQQGGGLAAVPAPAAAAAPLVANAGDDAAEYDMPVSRGAAYPPHSSAVSFSPRTDYSTREVDFYYGVRGQRLNSDAPSRKLGTGPADPTGPIASATGWLKSILGGKTKEKGKGFEVVRSARMPPAMKARGGDFDDDGPPPGIPVAMNVIRSGPIESDDEDEKAKRKKTEKTEKTRAASEQANRGSAGVAPGSSCIRAAPLTTPAPAASTEGDLLDMDSNSDGGGGDVSPLSDDGDQHGTLPPARAVSGAGVRSGNRIVSRSVSRTSYGAGTVPILDDVPHPPKKRAIQTPTEPAGRQNLLVVPAGLASSSVGDAESSGGDSTHRRSGSGLGDVHSKTEDDESADAAGNARPASMGYVHQGNVTHVQTVVPARHESAEVVDER